MNDASATEASVNRDISPRVFEKSLKRHQEVWYLKFNLPETQSAFWLRFTLLVSANGFKKVAETWAIYFKRNEEGGVDKTALKQTFDLHTFSPQKTGFQLGHSQFSKEKTKGKIQSKGKTISWNFKMTPDPDLEFQFVPESLKKSGMIKNQVSTVSERLLFEGTFTVNRKKITVDHAYGMAGHYFGPRTGNSWVWGHCNNFLDENGKPQNVVFDGLTARTKLLGGIQSPPLSSFFFYYQGKAYRFNTLWDSFRCSSKSSLDEWNFQVDRGDLSFRGHIQARTKEFAGLTYEDTDGTFLYCSNSKLSHMTLLVYRSGKLEKTLTSDGTTAFEITERKKNPYVPLLV